MTKQERISWVQLIVNAVIGCLYFGTVLRLPGDTHLLGPGMAPFIVVIILVAILTGLLSERILRRIQRRAGSDPDQPERLDERDRVINLRATFYSHRALVVAICVVLSLILVSSWLPSWGLPPSTPTDTVLLRALKGPLSGALIAQLLLLALTCAELCKYATRIVSYRRGY